MKKSILLVVIALMMFSCDTKENSRQGFRTHSQDTDSFTSGDWYISQYIKDGTEQIKFSDYNFRFAPDNSFSVSAGKITYTGNWWVPGIDGNENTMPADLDFVIDIKAVEFAELSKEWIISERSIDELKLIS